MAKRLSSLMTGPPHEDKVLPAMPPDSPASPGDSTRSRLQKQMPGQSHSRSASGQVRTPTEASQPSLQELVGAGGPSPLLPPPVIGGGAAGVGHSRSSSIASVENFSRPSSRATGSRPGTPTLMVPGQTPSTQSSPVGGKEHKRKKSWFGGGSKAKSEERGPAAWIAGSPEQLAYDTDGLVNGRPMKELWDDTDGNCFVYLFPRNSGRGASFKVDSAVFASSHVLRRLAFGESHSNGAAQQISDRRQPPLDARFQGLSVNDPNTPPTTPPQPKRIPGHLESMSSSSSMDSRSRLSNLSDNATETHLYLPLRLLSDGNVPISTQSPQKPQESRPKDPAQEDLQTLIDIRNFFAFLCGQSLVATERRNSFFHIFMTVAGIMKSYEFSNLDGSTFGETASASFDNYVEELGLADVRSSREKTIEGIVLGERMKSVLLYNEAFTHGVGKHEDIVNMHSSKYALISPITQNRLIRASMDLDKRTASIRLILNDFEFPTLFVGIMSSKTSSERKEGVRFDAWKEAFLGFRKNLLNLYKARYGDWPPKAKSKKNDLETSGLNRLVVRDMYHDMSSLYDMLVDRTSLTSRTVDGVDLAGHKEEATVRGLRAVLSEYDRSSPPVKPPVPFDLPKLPTLKSTRPDFGTDKRKDIKAIQKKIKDDEMMLIQRKSYNEDSAPLPGHHAEKAGPPTFLDFFVDMEKRAAHGCTISELVDLRIGQWIFMYVVLQALPMLACDAPGLKHTRGVEYFLCEPPRSGVPWANPNAAGAGSGTARTWFSVGEGGGVVSLPSDVVEHGVEGIYRRSHCWAMAEKWTSGDRILNEALHEKEEMDKAAADADPAMPPNPADGLPAPPGQYSLHPPASVGSGSRPSSRNSNRNSTFGLGLEALPLPVGVTPDGPVPSGYPPSHGSAGSRPVSRAGTPDGMRSRSAAPPQHVVDSSKTFDAILAGVGGQEKKGKRK